MTELAFVDTETTGLDPKRHHIWEVAVITAIHNVGDARLVVAQRWSSLVALPPRALAKADPMALKIGRFYERYPWTTPGVTRPRLTTRREAAEVVLAMTADRHLLGAVPSFDERRLSDLLRTQNLTPTWHYHLIDVETLAAGYLAGCAREAALHDESDAVVNALHAAALPPWRSDELLGNQLGVVIDEELRHTAMGDADWALRAYAEIHNLDITEQSEAR